MARGAPEIIACGAVAGFGEAGPWSWGAVGAFRSDTRCIPMSDVESDPPFTAHGLRLTFTSAARGPDRR
jgi:hypothetical protein